MKNENKFQSELKKEIEKRHPGCIIIKNDCHQIQGFPDLTVFKDGKYAWLECKKNSKAEHQPNQDYYVAKANSDGGLGRFIYPENKEEVLNELDTFFGI